MCFWTGSFFSIKDISGTFGDAKIRSTTTVTYHCCSPDTDRHGTGETSLLAGHRYPSLRIAGHHSRDPLSNGLGWKSILGLLFTRLWGCFKIKSKIIRVTMSPFSDTRIRSSRWHNERRHESHGTVGTGVGVRTFPLFFPHPETLTQRGKLQSRTLAPCWFMVTNHSPSADSQGSRVEHCLPGNYPTCLSSNYLMSLNGCWQNEGWLFNASCQRSLLARTSMAKESLWISENTELPFVCFLFAATFFTVIFVFTAQSFCVAKTPV